MRPGLEVQLALPGHPVVRPAVRVRLRPELHDVRVSRPADKHVSGNGHRQCPSKKHRRARRRRGGAGLLARRHQLGDPAGQGAGRLPASDPAARRDEDGPVSDAAIPGGRSPARRRPRQRPAPVDPEGAAAEVGPCDAAAGFGPDGGRTDDADAGRADFRPLADQRSATVRAHQRTHPLRRLRSDGPGAPVGRFQGRRRPREDHRRPRQRPRARRLYDLPRQGTLLRTRSREIKLHLEEVSTY